MFSVDFCEKQLPFLTFFEDFKKMSSICYVAKLSLSKLKQGKQ